MDDEAGDDRALLTRHVNGDREAFGVLVARHRDRLWRVALRTLGDADDAADAVQEALISAFRSAATYRGEAAVTTWLHRIVVNACLDLARRRAARPSASLDTAARADVADEAAAASFDASDAAAAVHAGLRRLPIDLATAVVLVDIEGMSVREAAQVLDVPEGTVKSRCARGRARLADALRDLAPAERNVTAVVPVQPLEDPKPPEGNDE